MIVQDDSLKMIHCGWLAELGLAVKISFDRLGSLLRERKGSVNHRFSSDERD